jgi:hypothetical protein
MKTKLGIMIGADPEFEFKDKDGHFISAYDAISNAGIRPSTARPFGTDANSDTAEIRPDAGSYYQVHHNISKLLTEAKVTGCNAFAGSGDDIPLGGHIHFSGIRATRELTHALDVFIAEPLNAVSNTNTRRHRFSYGHYGETRSNEHGWEYRAPLSWLSTPVITKGVLAVAWILARAAKHNIVQTLDTREKLLDYAYKGERIAVKLLYETLAKLQADGKNLETIEIFRAWHKTSRPKPERSPTFSTDAYMAEIQAEIASHNATRKTAARYDPFKCYRQINFYGSREDRTADLAVFTVNPLFRDVDQKHLGCKVESDTKGSSYYSFGLSYNLRKNPAKAAWTIKRIIKTINAEYKATVLCNESSEYPEPERRV